MPRAAREEIHRRANEIAIVANSLVFPATEALTGTLRFEVNGYVVNYMVEDTNQTLTVLSVFARPAE